MVASQLGEHFHVTVRWCADSLSVQMEIFSTMLAAAAITI